MTFARSSTTSAHTRRSISRRRDRKSTRLNSSHSQISYAVFCLKKKKLNHFSQPTTVALSSFAGAPRVSHHAGDAGPVRSVLHLISHCRTLSVDPHVHAHRSDAD